MKKQFVLYCVFLLAACGGGSTETLIAPTPTIGFISKSLAENFDVQGHRGARGLKPENTLPAFETALDMGVSTLELDLHFTVDQVVIIWHDDKISTNKCSTNTNLLLSQLTLKQLKTYHCSRNPDTNRFPFQNNSATTLAGKNYQIQTLDELFTFVQKYANSSKKSKAQRDNAKKVSFNIETKRTYGFPQGINDNFDGVNIGEFELAILAQIKKHELEKRTIIQSFDHRSLWAIRSINSSVQLAVLTNKEITNPALYSISGANIWSPNYQRLSASLINKAHNANLRVIPWTINNPDSMRKLIKMGVDGIITDRPDLLLTLDNVRTN